MKNLCFVFMLLTSAAAAVSAQTTLLKPRQQPTPDAQFASPAPQTSASPSSAADDADAEARRKAALNKVKGVGYTPKPVPKGGPASPVTYGTESTGPSSRAQAPDPATSMTVHGERVARSIKPGVGQAGYEIFTPVNQLHYVQFAVYCKDTPVDKAPPIEGLYLLWHPDSTCPGGAKGASYIVKGYQSREEALAAVQTFRANKIECWYNSALTGAEVEIIGVR